MAPTQCIMCNAPDAHACHSCKSVFYCSNDCQKKDWGLHKLVCRIYTNFMATRPRPFPEAKLALIFPYASKTIWFLWSRHIATDSYGSFLARRPDWEIISLPARGLPDGDHTVYGYCHGRLDTDGSKPNAAVHAMMEGLLKHAFRGSLIFYSKRGGPLEERGRIDFTPADLRVIFNFFKSYSDTASSTRERELQVGQETWRAFYPDGRIANLPFNRILTPNVKGVEILCVGAEAANNGRKYVEIEVPFYHPAFTDFDATKVSIRMGLPLVVERTLKETKEDLRYTQNLSGKFMHLNSDTHTNGWGLCTPIMQWQEGVGTVRVVRQDRQDLTPQQVEAFSRFNQYFISRCMEKLAEAEVGNGLGQGERVELREAFVRAFMNRAKFEEFFDDLKYERAEGGKFEQESGLVELAADPSWAIAVSPYTV